MGYLCIMVNYYCNFWLLVSLNFPKTLMVLLVCLTFVGQAMASTIMSYHMMSMGVKGVQEQLQNMPMMDHCSGLMKLEGFIA